MDFGKAKTVLIVLFLFVNIFLIYNLINLSDNSIEIDKNSIDETISILNQRGITIDKELIPAQIEHMDYLDLSNPLTDSKDFARNLVKGENVVNNSYVGDGGTLTIQNGTFLWEPTDKGDILTDALPSSKTAKKVLDYLKRNNINTKDLKWVGSLDLGEGKYEVNFKEFYMGHEFFNVKTSVVITKDGIESVRGKYFNIDSVKTTGSLLKSPLNILLDFSSTVKDENVVISNLTSGYYTDVSSENYKHLPAVPCWKITLKNGTEIYYDGITSELIFLNEL